MYFNNCKKRASYNVLCVWLMLLTFIGPLTSNGFCLSLASEEFIQGSGSPEQLVLEEKQAVITERETKLESEENKKKEGFRDIPETDKLRDGSDAKTERMNTERYSYPSDSSGETELFPEAKNSKDDINQSEKTNKVEDILSTNDSTNTVANASNKAEKESNIVITGDEPIPSFSEWTQLQHEKQQQNGGSQKNGADTIEIKVTLAGQHSKDVNGKGKIDSSSDNFTGSASISVKTKGSKLETSKKNFASPDCGAKILQTNPEAQNSNAILSSSHDEYMLNKCGVSIWFVIELCEPVKIEKISIGNLELFSSSPKEFDLGISDRFPTRDWVRHGLFTMPDVRSIHTFELPSTNSTTFGKYIKVNIFSHYGTEHYCPLSIVRIHGKSEYEVLESETIQNEEVKDHVDFSDYEEVIEMNDKQNNENNVLRSAKDVVMDIVKKAARAFSPSEAKVALANNTVDTKSSYTQDCKSLIQCLDWDMETKETIQMISCQSDTMLRTLSSETRWCKWEHCHAIFSTESIGSPWQIEGFYSAIYGRPHLLRALCHYKYPLFGNCSLGSFNGTLSNSSIHGKTEPFQRRDLINDSTVPTYPTSSDSLAKADEVHDQNTTNLKSKTTNFSTPIDVNPTNKTSAVLASSLNASGVIQADNEANHPTLSNNETEAVSTMENASEDAMSTSGQIQTTLPAPNPQQKESVFMRLSNRIKTLEKNQTMTAGYLEELSRRFKKQAEDMLQINEMNKKLLNHTKLRSLQVESMFHSKINRLRRNIEDIRERLYSVQLQRSLLIVICVAQLISSSLMIYWVNKKMRHIIQEKYDLYSKDSKQMAKGANVALPVSLKRSTSDGNIEVSKRTKCDEKPKKPRKRKKLSCSKGCNKASIDKNFSVKENNPSTSDQALFISKNNSGSKDKFVLLDSCSGNDELLARPRSLSIDDSLYSHHKICNSDRTIHQHSLTSLGNESYPQIANRFAILASPEPIAKKSAVISSQTLFSLESKENNPADLPTSTSVQPFSEAGKKSASLKKRRNSLKNLMPKLFDRQRN